MSICTWENKNTREAVEEDKQAVEKRCIGLSGKAAAVLKPQA
jgi:hypothetical protein